MEVQTVQIGVLNTGGVTHYDARRVVVFEAEQLAMFSTPGIGKDGRLTDTRGTKDTLFRLADGRYVVFTEEWSRYMGEPCVFSLHFVTLADLSAGGSFELLGAEAGLGRALTIDEAATPWTTVRDDPF